MAIIYLAIPYRGQEYTSYCVANIVAARLIQAGNSVFSPISHGHAITRNTGERIDEKTWQDVDIEILKRCDVVAVVKLDGWERSLGVAEEMTEADGMCIPVIYIDPTWYVSREQIEKWQQLDGAYELVEVAEE